MTVNRQPTCWVLDLTIVIDSLEPLLQQFFERRSWWLKAWIDQHLEDQLLMTVVNKYPEAEGELSVLRLNTYEFNLTAEQLFFDLSRTAVGLFRGDCVTKLDCNLCYILVYDT